MAQKHTVPGPNGPTKTPGWFSWRHQTREAHDRARDTYLAAHGPVARRRRAAEREATRGEDQ